MKRYWAVACVFLLLSGCIPIHGGLVFNPIGGGKYKKPPPAEDPIGEEDENGQSLCHSAERFFLYIYWGVIICIWLSFLK